VANYLRVVGFETGSDGKLTAAIAEDDFSGRGSGSRTCFRQCNRPFLG